MSEDLCSMYKNRYQKLYALQYLKNMRLRVKEKGKISQIIQNLVSIDGSEDFAEILVTKVSVYWNVNIYRDIYLTFGGMLVVTCLGPNKMYLYTRQPSRGLMYSHEYITFEKSTTFASTVKCNHMMVGMHFGGHILNQI